MYVISLVDFDALGRELDGRHHPHYLGTRKTEFNNLAFSFKPFTGDEPEPVVPQGVFEGLSRPAMEALDGEYRDARTLWLNARYITALTKAAAGAEPVWAAYTQAREGMDEAFAQLASTEDGRWRAAVSRLVTAQDEAVKAAEEWDSKAERIAVVHPKYMYSSLSMRKAEQLAGCDASWDVRSADDYTGWARRGLAAQVRAAVEEQRRHLATVDSLSRGLVGA